MSRGGDSGTGGPQGAFLADGRRLHLQHGPIDLIIEAVGAPTAVARAYAAARARFDNILGELVGELSLLRKPCPRHGLGLNGAVARRMEMAVRPFWRCQVTPMAAVAGAVADEIAAVMAAQPGLRRLYVNNGGDIAFAIGPGEAFTIGIVADPRDRRLAATVHLRAADGIAGIATSGRHGRSFSLGIADAVTVLAANAAAADAAATLIANRVDLPGTAAIRRLPANQLTPDSDLGDRLVTVDVGPLDAEAVGRALAAGTAAAGAALADGLIAAAYLSLNGEVRIAGARHDSLAGPPGARSALAAAAG